MAGAWSPDGTKIATAQNGENPQNGADDFSIRIWDVNTRQTITQLVNHTNYVTSLDWSPDGTRLASGGIDETIRIWNTTTWQTIKLVEAPNSVYAVAWSPDGSKLAHGGASDGGRGGGVTIIDTSAGNSGGL